MNHVQRRRKRIREAHEWAAAIIDSTVQNGNPFDEDETEEEHDAFVSELEKIIGRLHRRADELAD